MSSIDGKDAKTRKGHPVHTGVLAYFPDAILAIAELSRIGNDQHNPGQPLHWAKEKSNDHADCLARHQLDAGKVDNDGVLHSTKVAWRALAQLQIEIEKREEAKRGKTVGVAGMTSTQTAPLPPLHTVQVGGLTSTQLGGATSTQLGKRQS